MMTPVNARNSYSADGLITTPSVKAYSIPKVFGGWQLEHKKITILGGGWKADEKSSYPIWG